MRDEDQEPVLAGTKTPVHHEPDGDCVRTFCDRYTYSHGLGARFEHTCEKGEQDKEQHTTLLLRELVPALGVVQLDKQAEAMLEPAPENAKVDEPAEKRKEVAELVKTTRSTGAMKRASKASG